MRTIKLPLTIAQHEMIKKEAVKKEAVKKEAVKKNASQSAMAKYIFIMGAQQYFKPVEAVVGELEPADLVAGD